MIFKDFLLSNKMGRNFKKDHFLLSSNFKPCSLKNSFLKAKYFCFLG